MKKHLCHALLLIALAAMSLSSCSLLPTEKKPNVEQTTVEASTAAKTDKKTETDLPTNTEEIETTCNHSYGEWKTVSEATLVSNGKQQRVCASCGKTEQKSYQHEWNANASTNLLSFDEDAFYGCTVRLKNGSYSYTGIIQVPALSPGGNVVKVVDSAGFYASKASEIKLPETITRIDDRAFSNCTNLTFVTIPEGVTRLGSNLLENCTNVKTVYFNAISCAGSEFSPWGDTSKIETLIVGNRVQHIPKGLFRNSTTLKTVDLGKSVEVIHGNAFWEATALKNIQFPSSCKTIRDYAFYKSGLTEVILPDTIQEIGSFAFAYIHIDQDQLVIPQGLKHIDDGVFADAGTVKTLVYNATSATCSNAASVYPPFTGLCVEELQISDQVTSLGWFMFSNINGIKTVEINVLSEGVFADTTTLETVVLGSRVKKIPVSAFSGCTSLKEIQGFEQITHIGGSAFMDCSSLHTLDLSRVVEWGHAAFSGSGLSEVILSDTMTVLSSGAFAGCAKLKTITLPASLTKIDADAFYGSGIESIVIPDTVTEIGMYAFRYCHALSELVLPQTLTKIGGSCFEQCTSLTEVRLPDTLTKLGGHAFLGCTSLESINIPSALDTLPEHLFSSCTSLKTVVFENHLTKLPDGLFSYCSSLESVTLPDSLTAIGDGAFFKCTSLKSIVIPDSCTTIGSNAFYGCTQLENVIFGKNVTTIMGTAFSHCESLREITLPSTVTRIESWAFGHCSKLEKVDLGSGITFIGSEAFLNCTALRTIFLPKSLAAYQPENAARPIFNGNNDLIAYTDIESIPVLWFSHFGTVIRNGYTYEQYLQEVS